MKPQCGKVQQKTFLERTHLNFVTSVARCMYDRLARWLVLGLLTRDVHVHLSRLSSISGTDFVGGVARAHHPTVDPPRNVAPMDASCVPAASQDDHLRHWHIHELPRHPRLVEHGPAPEQILCTSIACSMSGTNVEDFHQLLHQRHRSIEHRHGRKGADDLLHGVSLLRPLRCCLVLCCVVLCCCWCVVGLLGCGCCLVCCLVLCCVVLCWVGLGCCCVVVVLSCLVLSCLVLSCLVLSCLVLCCVVLCCVVLCCGCCCCVERCELDAPADERAGALKNKSPELRATVVRKNGV